MIRFDDATFTYPDAAAPTFAGVSFTVDEGELCLVVGPTGSGKSTLLRAVNGLVPRFTGGLLTGEVTVDGRRTEDHPPRELADVVGFVGQDPMAGFVTDTVKDELAYVMENLGVPADVMRRRVEDVLDLLGLHELRRRPLRALSGGQQQRVAIGSVLTASPRVLVLDEPTSALDPAAAEDVLAALTRLVHDLGITVLIAEHRLERVVQYADRVVLLPGAGADLVVGDPATVLADSPVAPPVVELGRLAGWSPLPLSIRDARRLSTSLRDRLEPPGRARAGGRRRAATSASALVQVEHLHAAYGDLEVLGDVSVSVARGEVVAIMGRNGSGKSTLLAHLVGLRTPAGGSVLVDGIDPAGLAPTEAIKRVGLVPQDPTLLLYHDSVAEECTSADHDAGLAPGTTAAMLESVVPDVDAGHPPPRPVRGPAPRGGARDRAGRRAARRPARRTHPRPRLRRQAPPGRGPGAPGRRGTSGHPGHPRRRGRRPARRPGGRARRRRRRRRRPGPRGRVPLADLRPAGGQGPRAAARG